MASIDEIFDVMLKLEFNDASNALHWNSTESGYTYMGIYRTAHPKWVGWKVVDDTVKVTGSIKEASKKLYKDVGLTEAVKGFYEKEFWLRMKLDKVESQKIANEMFVFGVNAGTRASIKLSQEIVGVTIDGDIGPKTLEALNKFNEDTFDRVFDEKEIKHYEALAAKNPTFKIYLNGWTKRAKVV